MKKQLSLSIVCLFLMAGLAFGQTSQTLNFYTTGSTTQDSLAVTPGSTFSLDVYFTFSGFDTATGTSYWLQAETGIASNLILNSETYIFWNETQPGNNSAFTVSEGVDPGFLRVGRDLGATSNFEFGTGLPLEPRSPGTYHVATLNFTIDGGAAPGTYSLASTTILRSILTDFNGGNGPIDRNFPTAFFTLTVVPEPTTWSLLALGALGGTVGLIRKRRRAAV